MPSPEKKDKKPKNGIVTGLKADLLATNKNTVQNMRSNINEDLEPDDLVEFEETGQFVFFSATQQFTEQGVKPLCLTKHYQKKDLSKKEKTDSCCILCQGGGVDAIEMGNFAIDSLYTNLNPRRKTIGDNFEEVFSKQAGVIASNMMRGKFNALYSGIEATYFYIKDNRLLISNIGTIR